MSQPIGKHRKIVLIMEPCGSSISDIQGHGHAVQSVRYANAWPEAQIKRHSSMKERMVRSAKIIEK